jgi:phosphopantothenoylcysteine decarboxylase/phosphopantothenate--cysteine ligase
VLAALARRRSDGQTLVGFAAEHGVGAVERGREKLLRKSLDAIVVNDVSRADIGFEVDFNEVSIVTAQTAFQPRANGSHPVTPEGDATRAPAAAVEVVPRASKAEVAEAILDAVERIRAAHSD